MENSKSAIALALSKAQAEFIQPEKNKTVTVYPKNGGKPYSFDYADYNAIVEAVRGPLTKNGIAFTHLLEFRGEASAQLILVTKLIHGESGQELESVWPITDSSDAKEVGGDMTYGKRYSLSAITGCVADDDTDAPGEKPEAFQDRKPGYAPSFQEHDLPIDTKPPSKTNPIKIGPGAAASKAAEAGKNWSAFWAGCRDLGWTSEEVHAKAFEEYAVSTLTALAPQQLSALKEFIKMNPKVQS